MEVKTSTDSNWRGLFKIAGVAGIVAGLLCIVDVMVFVVFPQPTTVEGWFALFQKNWLVGLLDLDLLGILAYVILFPVILSLFIILRKTSQSWTAIATIMTFIGMAVYFASNTAFSLLSISNQYAAATTDAQKIIFLAAGQTLITIFLQTAFSESFIFVSSALLLTSIIMLRSNFFSRKTVYIGILANLAALGGFAPLSTVALLLMFANPVVLGIWLVLVGRTLSKLGKAACVKEVIKN